MQPKYEVECRPTSYAEDMLAPNVPVKPGRQARATGMPESKILTGTHLHAHCTVLLSSVVTSPNAGQQQQAKSGPHQAAQTCRTRSAHDRQEREENLMRPLQDTAEQCSKHMHRRGHLMLFEVRERQLISFGGVSAAARRALPLSAWNALANALPAQLLHQAS